MLQSTYVNRSTINHQITVVLNFDFAYSSLAIHYIEDWTNVFKEVYRVLKPDSFFIFSCNHPVTYAMRGSDTEENWISKLEVVKNKNTRQVSVIGDYMTDFKVMNALGKDSVNTWRKSFSEISKEIHAAGLVIEQIIEPTPLKELEAISPEVFKRLSKIPKFAIF
ncbi:methyltransferase domain-containing protein [Arenimonas sp.]|nr:methyltransferase domain-containing protein [Candidatus Parcubacteria bacterium]